MQKFTSVRSTAPQVLPMEQDDYHVIINNGIKEIHEEPKDEDMSTGFDGWEIAEQIIYTKDEYIQLLTDQNASLEAQTTSLQVALVEVYEMML